MTHQTYALSGNNFCIAGEDPAEFDAFMTALRDSARPAGPFTAFIVEELGQLQWKIRRAASALREQWDWLHQIIAREGLQEPTLSACLRRDIHGFDLVNKLERYQSMLRREFRRTYRLIAAPPAPSRANPGPQNPAPDSHKAEPSSPRSTRKARPADLGTKHLSTDSTDFDTFPASVAPASFGAERVSTDSTDFDTFPASVAPASFGAERVFADSTDFDTPPVSVDPVDSGTTRVSSRPANSRVKRVPSRRPKSLAAPALSPSISELEAQVRELLDPHSSARSRRSKSMAPYLDLLAVLLASGARPGAHGSARAAAAEPRSPVSRILSSDLCLRKP